jgi:hypothetical protein
LRGAPEVQTGQGQPITGMPWLVPVPRKRSLIPPAAGRGQATAARKIGGSPLTSERQDAPPSSLA